MLSLKRGYVSLLERYTWFLRTANKSPRTVTAYVSTVRRFLPVQDDGAPDAVLRYLGARRRLGLSTASINQEISALRSWFGWLDHVDPGAWTPGHFPRMRRGTRRLPWALSDADMGRLLAAPDLGTFVGFRDHVIMATLYQCGLRASELASLTLGDVRIDGLLYVRGKGGKDRLVPFGGAWRGLLEAYLERRAGTRPGKRSALFVTRQGRALRDGRSVWVIVNRYARRVLGLACGYGQVRAYARGRPWQGHYPHLLRAACATELMQRGMPLPAIAQILGHASLETTARYLAVDLAHLREAAGRHPRARRVSTDGDDDVHQNGRSSSV